MGPHRERERPDGPLVQDLLTLARLGRASRSTSRTPMSPCCPQRAAGSPGHRPRPPGDRPRPRNGRRPGRPGAPAPGGGQPAGQCQGPHTAGDRGGDRRRRPYRTVAIVVADNGLGIPWPACPTSSNGSTGRPVPLPAIRGEWTRPRHRRGDRRRPRWHGESIQCRRWRGPDHHHPPTGTNSHLTQRPLTVGTQVRRGPSGMASPTKGD